MPQQNLSIATGRAKNVLLLSKKGSEMPTMKGRPCANVNDEKTFRELLSKFGYGVELFSELEEEICATDPKKSLPQRFDLTIVDLSNLDEASTAFLPIVITSSVPCIFVGDPTNIDDTIREEISRWIPTDFSLEWLPTRFTFIGCGASLSALLDMNRRIELYKELEHEPEKQLRALVLADLDNRMEGKRNGK